MTSVENALLILVSVSLMIGLVAFIVGYLVKEDFLSALASYIFVSSLIMIVFKIYSGVVLGIAS